MKEKKHDLKTRLLTSCLVSRWLCSIKTKLQPFTTDNFFSLARLIEDLKRELSSVSLSSVSAPHTGKEHFRFCAPDLHIKIKMLSQTSHTRRGKPQLIILRAFLEVENMTRTLKCEECKFLVVLLSFALIGSIH